MKFVITTSSILIGLAYIFCSLYNKNWNAMMWQENSVILLGWVSFGIIGFVAMINYLIVAPEKKYRK